MKKLIYLFVVVAMFAFMACGGGEKRTDAPESAVCTDDCQKACCLGCKATEGNAKCIVLEDGSMPCCIAKVEAMCCCGNETCDGSCHEDTTAASEAHDHE